MLNMVHARKTFPLRSMHRGALQPKIRFHFIHHVKLLMNTPTTRSSSMQIPSRETERERQNELSMEKALRKHTHTHMHEEYIEQHICNLV